DLLDRRRLRQRLVVRAVVADVGAGGRLGGGRGFVVVEAGVDVGLGDGVAGAGRLHLSRGQHGRAVGQRAVDQRQRAQHVVGQGQIGRASCRGGGERAAVVGLVTEVDDPVVGGVIVGARREYL